ncbi:MAG TPA: hypothetical protein VN316_01805, partial [candidate division Zixibacteria bacterium]|nr:hypothetical protein [candidate division Zixibacteria bacterium]
NLHINNQKYIIQNYHKYEQKEVLLRAEILDLETNKGEYIIIGKTDDMTYRIFTGDHLLDRVPQTGDVIDFRGVSYLDQGYVVALKAHIRTNTEHRLLFARSLIAIPIVLLTLWRQRHQLFGGT